MGGAGGGPSTGLEGGVGQLMAAPAGQGGGRLGWPAGAGRGAPRAGVAAGVPCPAVRDGHSGAAGPAGARELARRWGQGDLQGRPPAGIWACVGLEPVPGAGTGRAGRGWGGGGRGAGVRGGPHHCQSVFSHPRPFESGESGGGSSWTALRDPRGSRVGSLGHSRGALASSWVGSSEDGHCCLV